MTTNILQAGTFRDIWVNGDNDVYAVGGEDTILHYDGRIWRDVGCGLTAHGPTGVWGSSSTDVYVVGHYGTILHYDGCDWKNVEHGHRSGSFASIWGSSSDNVYVVPFQRDILHYDGVTWHRISHGYAPNAMCSIWGSGSKLYVAGLSSDGGVVYYFDGHKWHCHELTSNGLLGVWGSSVGSIYAVGAEGEVVEIGHFSDD